MAIFQVESFLPIKARSDPKAGANSQKIPSEIEWSCESGKPVNQSAAD